FQYPRSVKNIESKDFQKAEYPSKRAIQFPKKRGGPRNEALNRSIMNAPSVDAIFQLWQTSQKESLEFSVVNLSTTFNRISKLLFDFKNKGAPRSLREDQSDLFSQITQKAVSTFSDFEARELANTAN